MTRDMKNVKAEITALITKARVFLEEGDVEKAKKIADEAEELKKSYDLESQLLNLAKQSVPDKSTEPAKKPEEPTDVQKFCDALRTGKITKDMSEGTPADGGYTVPQDIRTRVETLRDSKFSLRQLVKIENVKTNEGRRTFKKRASQTGFTKVGEKGKIGKKDTPQ
jgi:HK97 family phage major capsid protein